MSEHARATGGLDVIGYVTLGTNDIARAGRYYDDLLSVTGAKFCAFFME